MKMTNNIKQKIAIFIHSLYTGAKMMSYIVCSWDDRKLYKLTFQSRATLQIYNL